MTMIETANLIQFLEAIGWNGDQIINLQLATEGRISIDEAARKHKEKDRKQED